MVPKESKDPRVGERVARLDGCNICADFINFQSAKWNRIIINLKKIDIRRLFWNDTTASICRSRELIRSNCCAYAVRSNKKKFQINVNSFFFLFFFFFFFFSFFFNRSSYTFYTSIFIHTERSICVVRVPSVNNVAVSIDEISIICKSMKLYGARRPVQ